MFTCQLACALLSAASLSAQLIKPGDRVRLTAPNMFVGAIEGRYAGSLGDTLIVNSVSTMRLPLASVTRVQVPGMKARGAGKGALWGAGIAAGIGVLYASDGLKSGIALAPSGALVGAIVGAVRNQWRDVLAPAFSDAPVIAAGQPRPMDSILAAAPPTPIPETPRVEPPKAVAADTTPALVVTPRTTKASLPQGFFSEQITVGARYGTGVGVVGGLAGYGAYVAFGDRTDDWGAIVAPLVGFMAGYLVGTPIGIHRYSVKHGVRAPFAAPLGGALVGSLGVGVGGIGFFFTVPVASAWAHNAARDSAIVRLP